uniref:Glutaredoxin-related protein 5, mitochondrial n=1 Tax=Culicoides sonorensis TaxID=179676 RepID=A0A336MT43_CULSO
MSFLRSLTRLSTSASPLMRSPNTFLRYFALETKDFDKMVKSNKVVVFMKGTPEEPRCGFSNAVVQILRMHGVTYDSHNVLENEDIRNGIKTYSNWPTIPQVFINGEFVGGCDILVSMHQNGELVDELKKVGIESSLKDAEGTKK